ACAALRQEDYITSTHRGHGHLIAKGARLDKMMAELYGKRTGYNKGKGGSMHIADFSIGILGANGIVGGGIPIATGAGISIRRKKEARVAICFFGDGASNRGTFHEGLNLGAVWKLPVVYVVENNLYAVSAPTSKTTAVRDISVRGTAYNIPGITVDGNDVLAVVGAVSEAVDRARVGKGPSLIECKTYRWRGHYEGDPLIYRTQEELEKWKRRDPIQRFKKVLIDRHFLSQDEDEAIKKKIDEEIEEAVRFAEQSPYPEPKEALQDVFEEEASAKLTSNEIDQRKEKRTSKKRMKKITYSAAIAEALHEEMARDEAVIVYGEDVGVIGGAFKATRGLQERFGEERVKDTPVSETAIVGSAVGAAMTGSRPVVELQHDAFVGVCMDEIFNQAAKMHYMSGGQAKLPLVIRTPLLGGGLRAAAQHTGRPEAWLLHVPGLKICVPSNPRDAKGLLKTAIRDNNPVIFFEHLLLYNKEGEVPEEEYLIPFGKAEIKQEGEEVTILATSLMVHKVLTAVDELAKEGISVEVIDPRTLVPLDKKTLINSVKKTGKLIIVSEDCKTAGIGAEICAVVLEEAFDYLDAPIKRVCTLDVPLPFSPPLEDYAVPNENDIINAVKELISS
ncbi:MAG: dehydrogenase E1 component subunit alpha/beta, partial [Candidatus Bathyarchaeota archaeon]|nr:dehydrogenase E1 component subunit alpha/beta [Candidatus Bathyarchaeota archaeon]